MADNYFENLKTVGGSLDEGISRLQEIWKMPHLLLCKNNEEDQIAAKKLIEGLRNELRILKESIEENKVEVSNIRESHTQILEEATKAINHLKDEVNDIKILFTENGYVEEPLENDLSILNDQLETLSINNSNSLMKDSQDKGSSMCDSGSFLDSSGMDKSSGPETPTNNSLGSIQKKSLLNQRPMEPTYSPYFYKIMKK